MGTFRAVSASAVFYPMNQTALVPYRFTKQEFKTGCQMVWQLIFYLTRSFSFSAVR